MVYLGYDWAWQLTHLPSWRNWYNLLIRLKHVCTLLLYAKWFSKILIPGQISISLSMLFGLVRRQSNVDSAHTRLVVLQPEIKPNVAFWSGARSEWSRLDFDEFDKHPLVVTSNPNSILSKIMRFYAFRWTLNLQAFLWIWYNYRCTVWMVPTYLQNTES